MTPNRYFGTDGIRGTFGEEPMTPAFVYRLGLAAGQALRDDSKDQSVFVIGRDTRTSGPVLQQALAAGLKESGARVLDLGIIPTPGIAYLTHFVGANAGAVISASHNPAPENGIKFLNSEGMKLSKVQEEAIEENLVLISEERSDFDEECLGEASPHLFETYLHDLYETVPGLDLSNLTILMDCSNGAAWKAGPEVFRRLGANLVAMHTENDGFHINVDSGSEFMRSKPAVLAARVAEEKADLAIAFDGDTDRVIMMDEQGNLIDGDHMLALLAEELHAQNRLLGDAMVTTVMANGALRQFADEKGFTLIQTPVGDKYVTEELIALSEQHQANGKLGLGGEQSGHIILLDENHRTGDGIRTALFILNLLTETPGQTLSQLAKRIEKFNQVVASCNVASKIDLETLPGFQERLEYMKEELPGLVQWNSRYSGTEPKYRLMLEADQRSSAQDVVRVAWEICDLIQGLTNTPAGAKIEVLNVSQGGLMPRP
jgi:phosphoglucosamine mutase